MQGGMHGHFLLVDLSGAAQRAEDPPGKDTVCFSSARLQPANPAAETDPSGFDKNRLLQAARLECEGASGGCCAAGGNPGAVSRGRTRPGARVLAPLAVAAALFLLLPLVARFAVELPMRFAAGAAAERAASPLETVAVVYRRMGISIALSAAVFAAWGAGMGLALRWLRAELGLGSRRGTGSSWNRRRFTRRRG